MVKRERVDPEGPRLWVSGVDLVDGTPVFDIKPYVPYADALPEAVSSFANEAPLRIAVRWAVHVEMPNEDRSLIEQSIALKPQPAYQEDRPDRVYAGDFGNWQVRWRNEAEGAVIEACVRRG